MNHVAISLAAVSIILGVFLILLTLSLLTAPVKEVDG